MAAKKKVTTAQWHKQHKVMVDCRILEEGIEVEGSNILHTKIRVGNKDHTVPHFQVYNIKRPVLSEETEEPEKTEDSEETKE